MKVLFLPDYSAANAYQRELSAALRDLGVTVTADPTRPRRILPVLEAVRRHGRPDIVHLHWTEPYVAARGTLHPAKARRTLLELRLMKTLGSALVWTAHDLFRHDRPVDRREAAFMRQLFGLSDGVIAHCESAADALVAALGLPTPARERVRVIPHGHYAGAYADTVSRAEARDRLALPRTARVVAFVGWVRPYKGVAELVEAFARVGDPQARLVIAGEALDAGYAARIAGLAGKDPRVDVRLGFVPDDELQVYLRAADVVATPFLEILTSGSVLLAMSFGLPVIAPRMGCVAETVDDDGAFLYAPDEPGALEVALRRALGAHDDELARMGARDRERLADLSWDRVALATRHLYEAVSPGR